MEAVGCRIVAVTPGTPRGGAPGGAVSGGGAPRNVGGSFVDGMRLLGRGFGMYARSPRMLVLGLIPAVISLLVIGFAFALLIIYIDDVASVVTWFAVDWPASQRRVLVLAAEVAIILTAVLIAVFTYTALTLIIGDPFYEVISKRVEDRAGGAPTGVEVPWHRSLRWNLIDSLRLLVLSVSVSVPLFICGFIPVVGQTVVPVIAALAGGWLLAVELTGIPFNQRGLRLRDRRRILRANRALALGFGVPVYLMMLVPFLGVLVVPAAVAASTLLTRRVLGQPIDR
jgi:CysZ protein